MMLDLLMEAVGASAPHPDHAPRHPTATAMRYPSRSRRAALLDTLLYTDVTPGYMRAVPAALVAFNAATRAHWRAWSPRSTGASTDAASGKMAIPRPNDELRGFSEGAYLAYACSDYPQLWDIRRWTGPSASAVRAAIAELSPSVTKPWTPQEWASSEFFVYDYCIGWPKPTVAEPPFPGGRYPNFPMLVLNGDLDLRTDVYQARDVADNFPNSHLRRGTECGTRHSASTTPTAVRP